MQDDQSSVARSVGRSGAMIVPDAVGVMLSRSVNPSNAERQRRRQRRRPHLRLDDECARRGVGPTMRYAGYRGRQRRR